MPKTLAPTPSASAPDAAASPAPTRRKIRARLGGPAKAKRRRSNEPAVVLTHLPDRVVVLAGRVLPALVQQPLVPGVGGVRRLKDGSWDYSGLRDDDEQRGGIFLDPVVHGYVEEDETGEIYNTWGSPVGYARFVEELISADAIPAPSADEVRAYIERQSQIVDAAKSNLRNSDAYTPEIERQLKIAQEWLAEHGEAA